MSTDSNMNSNSDYRNQENIRENENKEKGPRKVNQGDTRRKYQDLAEAQLKASILLNEHQIYKDIRKKNQVYVLKEIFFSILFILLIIFYSLEIGSTSSILLNIYTHIKPNFELE